MSTSSGTTAICVYLKDNKLVVGSVGDSRAILGVKWALTLPVPVGSHNSYYRKILPRYVRPVRLTIDQKPHHKGEKERIEAAGGRVARLETDSGGKLGPYRVMSRYGLAPGLAMSRALGDRLGEEVGVISEPLVHTFHLYKGRDKFIVLASDGVWDVLSNEEVACFVDTYLEISPKSIAKEAKAKIGAVSIARLVCEEARYRWMGLVETEGVVVDDISCIVIALPADPSISAHSSEDREPPHPISLQSTISLT